MSTEKTLSRETATRLAAMADGLLAFCEGLDPDKNIKRTTYAAQHELVNKAYSELYPAIYDGDAEQSFSDFKNTLDVSIPKGPEDYINVPTNDRYDTIPLNTLDTRYGTKEVNQFIP